jgi:hypothetical protein
MKRLIYYAALALIANAVLTEQANAQTSSVFLTMTPVAYPLPASSLKALSYGDLKYELGTKWIQLRKGKYRHRDKPFGSENADLQGVWFFDEVNGKPQHVLVSLLDVPCGGSCAPDGYVMLFEIRDGVLTETAKFAYDAHAPGTGAKFDGFQLTIFARSPDDGPNCCPKNLDVVTYSWQNQKFEQVAFLVKPVPAK